MRPLHRIHHAPQSRQNYYGLTRDKQSGHIHYMLLLLIVVAAPPPNMAFKASCEHQASLRSNNELLPKMTVSIVTRLRCQDCTAATATTAAMATTAAAMLLTLLSYCLETRYYTIDSLVDAIIRRVTSARLWNETISSDEREMSSVVVHM